MLKFLKRIRLSRILLSALCLCIVGSTGSTARAVRFVALPGGETKVITTTQAGQDMSSSHQSTPGSFSSVGPSNVSITPSGSGGSTNVPAIPRGWLGRVSQSFWNKLGMSSTDGNVVSQGTTAQDQEVPSQLAQFPKQDLQDRGQIQIKEAQDQIREAENQLKQAQDSINDVQNQASQTADKVQDFKRCCSLGSKKINELDRLKKWNKVLKESITALEVEETTLRNDISKKTELLKSLKSERIENCLIPAAVVFGILVICYKYGVCGKVWNWLCPSEQQELPIEDEDHSEGAVKKTTRTMGFVLDCLDSLM